LKGGKKRKERPPFSPIWFTRNMRGKKGKERKDDKLSFYLLLLQTREKRGKGGERKALQRYPCRARKGGEGGGDVFHSVSVYSREEGKERGRGDIKSFGGTS